MRDSFCGWYFKCQNQTHTIAVIPAYHTSHGEKSCSIQVLLDDASWNVCFPHEDYRKMEHGIKISGNYFGKEKIVLDLHTPELSVIGALSFGPFTPLKYDIMGPFKYVPFMECIHSVFSMKHTVNGALNINGVRYEFYDGTGYMEGDRGCSFPKEYVWTQCCFPEGSLMLSVADIPFCGFHFTGVTGAILYQGKEYRLGTYLGAKIVRIQAGEVVVKQGSRQFTARRLEEKGQPLAAPAAGKMTRTIHETAACRAYFHYQENGQTIFSFEDANASFEYEYPQ